MMKAAQRHRIGLLALSVLLWVGCSEPLPDEARIRQRIETMSAAAGDKDLARVMAPIHDDFLGNQRIRKANLNGLVFVHFRRHKHVHVFVNDVQVSLRGETAEVNCNVILAGRDQLLPEQGRVLQVISQWKKIDGDWMVMSASWQDPFIQQ
jgi:ketosteroid isomerase-like protein